MTALVVGGGGTVGRAVVAALEDRGYDVVAMTHTGHGDTLPGDVREPGLGLPRPVAAELRDRVTHVVSCFGSVALDASPAAAVSLHLGGTRNLIDFAAACPHLERLVHVSSVLVLGRAEGRIAGEELTLGQSFRNWYEYAKFRAEAELRERADLPWRVVRLGPVLGSDGATPNPPAGIALVLPLLLRGYPVHLDRAGRFPCYVGEAGVAAEVIALAAESPGGERVWTWFDPTMPSLAATLSGLCSAWGIFPRIVDVPLLGRLERRLGGTLGMPRAVVSYARPWVDIDPAVLDRIPGGAPQCPAGYLEAAGDLLRSRGSELAHA